MTTTTSTSIPAAATLRQRALDALAVRTARYAAQEAERERIRREAEYDQWQSDTQEVTRRLKRLLDLDVPTPPRGTEYVEVDGLGVFDLARYERESPNGLVLLRLCRGGCGRRDQRRLAADTWADVGAALEAAPYECSYYPPCRPTEAQDA